LSNAGYQSGITSGGKWGCAAAVLLSLPFFLFLLIGDALGDCIPEEPCQKGFVVNVALPTVIFASAIGFGVRAIVNRFARDSR